MLMSVADSATRSVYFPACHPACSYKHYFTGKVYAQGSTEAVALGKLDEFPLFIVTR